MSEITRHTAHRDITTHIYMETSMIEIKDKRVSITLNEWTEEVSPFTDVIDSIVRPFAYYHVLYYPLDISIRTMHGYIGYAEVGWNNFMVYRTDEDVEMEYTLTEPRAIIDELYDSLINDYDEWVALYGNTETAKQIIDEYIEDIKDIAEKETYPFECTYKEMPDEIAATNLFRLDAGMMKATLPEIEEFIVPQNTDTLYALMAGVQYGWIGEVPFTVCFDGMDGCNYGLFEAGDFFVSFCRRYDGIQTYVLEMDRDAFILSAWGELQCLLHEDEWIEFCGERYDDLLSCCEGLVRNPPGTVLYKTLTKIE